jgi:hypothetical protein
MNARLQTIGLAALTLLATLLLALIGYVFAIIGQHTGADGRIPSAEAFGLTALLLSFREVIASMRSIWDAVDRSNLTDKLAASLPSAATALGDGPSGTPSDPVAVKEVTP